MFTWLQSCLAFTLILACVASSSATEPAKSALFGNRPAVYDAPLPSSGCSSVLSSSPTGCETCYAGDLQHSRMSCGKSRAGGCRSGYGKHGCGHHCHGCNGYHQGHFDTRCNMIPHVAYINPMKSYYYFRPYQAFHVREQQNEVIGYGADPRQPYANLMFSSIYPELEAAWAEEAAHTGSPFEDEVPRGETPATNGALPDDSPAPDSNTSTPPVTPIRPNAQSSPAAHTEKPANNTAALPGQSPGAFRARR